MKKLFFVSGVRTNCYDPENPDACNSQGGRGESTTYENTETIAIPDDDKTGIVSTINIPDAIDFTSITVFVDIEHTFIGDLVLELTHNGKTVILQNQEGGSAENLIKEFRSTAFAGDSTLGTWALKVSDRTNMDSGRLNNWSITFGD